MKKLFLVLAVALASFGFVACNNEAETDTSAEDSARVADSIANEQKMQQDNMMSDTTNKMMSDTMQK